MTKMSVEDMELYYRVRCNRNSPHNAVVDFNAGNDGKFGQNWIRRRMKVMNRNMENIDIPHIVDKLPKLSWEGTNPMDLYTQVAKEMGYDRLKPNEERVIATYAREGGWKLQLIAATESWRDVRLEVRCLPANEQRGVILKKYVPKLW